MNPTLSSILQRIINILILNGSFIDNLGLLNGKMGICIFFYHLYRKTGEKMYEEYAGELLDEVFEGISIKTPMDFENGLTGIGWGIEYLVQQGFVEGDTNEVLESIDSSVLGGILSRPFTIMDDKELYGIGLYYLARIKGKESAEDNLSLLRIKTHIIYLLEDCKRLLTNKELFDVKVPQLTVRQLCSLTYFLIEIHKISLCPVLINKLLKGLPEYANEKLRSSDSWVDSITLIDLIYKDKFHKVSGIDLINYEMPHYNPVQESEQILQEFKKCVTYSLIYSLEFKEYEEIALITNQVFSFIQNEENWQNLIRTMDYRTLSLGNGLAGIGLSILNISEVNSEYHFLLGNKSGKKCDIYEGAT